MLKYDEWIKKSGYIDNNWGRRKYEEYTMGVGRYTELYCPVVKTKIDFTNFRERYGKGAAYYALQFKSVYPNQFSHLLYKINDGLIPKPSDFDAVNSLLGGEEKVSKQIKTPKETRVVMDVKQDINSKEPPWTKLHDSLIAFKKETKMTPNAFYIICHLRKDRAWKRWGKIHPKECEDIYNQGFSVTHIKSINHYAKELEMDRQTFSRTLKELEAGKISFTREVNGELFVITGKHYSDGTEALFSDLPEEERKCDL